MADHALLSRFVAFKQVGLHLLDHHVSVVLLVRYQFSADFLYFIWESCRALERRELLVRGNRELTVGPMHDPLEILVLVF